MKNTIYCCNECGSKKVEERVWRDCNTGEISGIGEADEDDCWCRQCEKNTLIIDIEDYKTKE